MHLTNDSGINVDDFFLKKKGGGEYNVIQSMMWIDRVFNLGKCGKCL